MKQKRRPFPTSGGPGQKGQVYSKSQKANQQESQTIIINSEGKKSTHHFLTLPFLRRNPPHNTPSCPCVAATCVAFGVDVCGGVFNGTKNQSDSIDRFSPCPSLLSISLGRVRGYVFTAVWRSKTPLSFPLSFFGRSSAHVNQVPARPIGGQGWEHLFLPFSTLKKPPLSLFRKEKKRSRFFYRVERNLYFHF